MASRLAAKSKLPRKSRKLKKDNKIRIKKSPPPRRVASTLQRLREQNGRLEKIIRIGPAALVIFDTTTEKITDINAASQQILGYSPKQLSALRASDLFRESGDYAKLCRLLEKDHIAVNQRYTLTAADRSPRMVQLYATRFEQNGVPHYLLNFWDLTEALSNEKTITAYDHKIRNLEHALDASSLVSITDAQGTIIYANARFCEVSQYQRNELLGQNHRIINSGYHSKEFMRGLWGEISRGKVWHGEIRNRRRDGSFYWVQSTIVPFLDKTGKPYQYYAIRQDITERKKFEEQLVESEQALRQAQRIAGLGSWEWLAETDTPRWSAEMYRIYGLNPADRPIPFAEVARLFTPESWARLEPAVQESYQTGKPYQLECEIIRTDNSRGWIVSSGEAFHNSEGKIIGLRGTILDITDRKKNEERNRLIVNALTDLIFIMNEDGIFQDYHAADAKRLAIAPENFLHKSFRDLFPEDVAQKLSAAIAAIRNGESSVEINYSLNLPKQDGFFEATISRLDKERILAVVRDVTERRKSEARLLEQATLLDNASDAILVRDLENTILYWNRSAERIYGWQHGEAIGKSARELLYEKTDDYDRAIQTVLQNGEYAGELKQRNKAGQELIVQTRWNLVKDESGRPKSILAINSDITERKKLEKQFLRAQRLESIGTLAGGIAHDLNNVLTPIMLAIEILKMSNIDDDQRDLLSTIEASSRRGADMVKQVLSFARGLEGNPILLKTEELLIDIEKIVRDTFPKNITYSITIAPDLWLICADSTQLHQVLLNLIVNARDAMPDGGNIRIGATNRTIDDQYTAMFAPAHAGNYVCINIEDTGTGMPADVVDKIFEPFFTTKEHGKGTGLGLSTSMAIVKSHGGFIRVYSEPGRGTQFHVFIPAITDPAETVKSAGAENIPRGNGKHILLVEDEISVRKVTQQTLESFGYRVTTAADGAEAIAIFAGQKDAFHLMLTDMMMPVLDGIGTIQVIRRLRPDLPIIAASGLDINEKIARLAGEGVFFFLSKPYTAEHLLKTIAQALEKKV